MLKTFMLAACLLAASALPRPVSAASAAPAIHMFFPWGTAELSAVALQLVDVVKSRVGPASRVSIVGHADTSEADPGALSQARATAVQKA
jgi:outer membrane protein OmpA-like peptidoglycan-associated protein